MNATARRRLCSALLTVAVLAGCESDPFSPPPRTNIQGHYAGTSNLGTSVAFHVFDAEGDADVVTFWAGLAPSGGEDVVISGIASYDHSAVTFYVESGGGRVYNGSVNDDRDRITLRDFDEPGVSLTLAYVGGPLPRPVP